MKETNKWLALIIVLVAPLLSVIDVYIVNMALPEIKQQYLTSDSNTELVISSYLLGYCVFLVTGGRAGDFFGRKKIFIIGILSFTITSALCGYAGTIFQLILFRFFQGVAAAFMIPQTLTIIQVTFREAKERNLAFGFFGITLGIASILGQFLGGYFVAHHYIEES
nr:MFS transporter [uncultured Flavobacterium sp.]